MQAVGVRKLHARPAEAHAAPAQAEGDLGHEGGEPQAQDLRIGGIRLEDELSRRASPLDRLGVDGGGVDAARPRHELGALRPYGPSLSLREIGDVADLLDPEEGEAPQEDGTDARQQPRRLSPHERALLVRREGHEAVGPEYPRRHLAGRLVRGQGERGLEARLLQDALPELLRRVDGGAVEAARAREVDEEMAGAGALDEGRVLEADPPEPLLHEAIEVEAAEA